MRAIAYKIEGACITHTITQRAFGVFKKGKKKRGGEKKLFKIEINRYSEMKRKTDCAAKLLNNNFLLLLNKS